MIGKTFAQYEITAQIGQGGMGAVYRARDNNLDRDVALKIITVAMSGDPERIARFQREAKTLASMQHPNIAAVHGFEDIDGVRFLVMELVEGADLSAHLNAGALPEDEAVEIIRRVADGLNEAHRNGIVHRDLKPANVMIASDGTVKILDFGLARSTTSDSDSVSDPGLSPTITAAMTQAGTILGTAAYMSPEQARGKAVDQRADIWAMGTILYEMLTGHRLFVGETTTDVLASVIKIEPDLAALPAGTSPQVRRMLERCLQRDPRKRLHSAADAVLELDEAAVPEAAKAGSRRSIWPWLVVGLLAVSLAGSLLRPSTGPEAAVRRHYELTMPSSVESDGPFRPMVSPDGRWLAVALRDSTLKNKIMLQSMETGEQSFVANSEGADFLFWSPDSRYLGFFQPGRMRKLHLQSGTTQIVTSEVKSLARGGAWASDGRILYAPGSNDGLWLVDENGGPVEIVTVVDSTLLDGSHRWPSFLPDGRRFIYTLWSNVLEERSEHGGIYLGSLNGGPGRRLLRDFSSATISATGELLFYRSGLLMAVDFDLEAGEVVGEPKVAAGAVAFSPPNGRVSVSVNNRGDIYSSTYQPDVGLLLGSVARNGELTTGVGENLPLSFGLTLGPDGRHYSAQILDSVGSVQIWIGDLERKSFSRLSRFNTDCWGVVFSPDGREVIYGVQKASGGAHYRHEISGAKPPVQVSDLTYYDLQATATDWFATDQVLINSSDQESHSVGIYLLDIQSQKMTPILADSYDQEGGQISPDGRWLAYVSHESGGAEIYVRNWPGLDRKWLVSQRGGTTPHWHQDGQELAFQSAGMEIHAVTFQGDGNEPAIGMEQKITDLGRSTRYFSYAADHNKFLVGLTTADLKLPPIQVLTGWQEAP